MKVQQKLGKSEMKRSHQNHNPSKYQSNQLPQSNTSKIIPKNQINTDKGSELKHSTSSKKITQKQMQKRSSNNIEQQSISNYSEPKCSNSYYFVDKIAQLHQRLKNIHHFYKTRIDQQKIKTSQRNEVFMCIFEEMQHSHNQKVQVLRKLIEQTQGEKKDVEIVDDRMNQIKGSIDQILKQSSDLKQSNQQLQKEINEKQGNLRQKQQQLNKLKEDLMESRNQLQDFERLNLRQNKRNKDIISMIEKSNVTISR